MKTRQKLGLLLFGVILTLAIAAVGDDPDGAQAELDQYCEMVALNRADPTVGWPDFDKSYDRECTDGKATAR